MKNYYPIKYTMFAGWFVVSIAIFIIADLFVGDRRTEYFWHRIAWGEVLNILFWCSIFLYVVNYFACEKSNNNLSRVAPIASIVICLYTLFSLFFMVVSAFVDEVYLSSSSHLILQVLIFTVTAVSLVFILISRLGDRSIIEFGGALIMTPKELNNLLFIQESYLTKPELQEIRFCIKQLREVLSYSFTESVLLYEFAEYKELSIEIKAMCEFLSTVTDNDMDFISLKDAMKKLIIKAREISIKQVRSN